MTVSPLNLSPGRVAWLVRLRDGGAVARGGQGRVAFDCMRAGLTEWEWVDREGRLYGTSDVEARFETPGAWHFAREAGWEITQRERITETGRQALKEKNL